MNMKFLVNFELIFSQFLKFLQRILFFVDFRAQQAAAIYFEM